MWRDAPHLPGTRAGRRRCRATRSSRSPGTTSRAARADSRRARASSSAGRPRRAASRSCLGCARVPPVRSRVSKRIGLDTRDLREVAAQARSTSSADPCAATAVAMSSPASMAVRRVIPLPRSSLASSSAGVAGPRIIPAPRVFCRSARREEIRDSRRDDAASTHARGDPRACWALRGMHAAAIAAIWTGVSGGRRSRSPRLLFVLRGFGLISAGYHRYFAHRRSAPAAPSSSRSPRVLGASAAQMGPLWWAATIAATTAARTPRRLALAGGGQLLRAHMGWLLCRRHADADRRDARTYARFPCCAGSIAGISLAPARARARRVRARRRAVARRPALATSGAQMLVVGFF